MSQCGEKLQNSSSDWIQKLTIQTSLDSSIWKAPWLCGSDSFQSVSPTLNKKEALPALKVFEDIC